MVSTKLPRGNGQLAGSTTAATISDKPRPRRNTWHYSRDGWRRVRWPFGAGNLDEQLAAAGYRHGSWFGLGAKDHGPEALTIELWENSKRERFLVVVNTQGHWYPVLVRGLPSLMALLKEWLPVIRDSLEIDHLAMKEVR